MPNTSTRFSGHKRKEKELFLAIFFNDTEKLIRIKNDYPEIYARKNAFEISAFGFARTVLDLKYLTLFNKIIWFDDDWRTGLLPFVNLNRQRILRIIDFWKSEAEAGFLTRDFPFNKYHEFFLCDDPNDARLKEEILYEPMADYLKKGFREIDLRLYQRVECFDFEQVEKLLKQGANPLIPIEDDPYSDIFSEVELEESFLATIEIVPVFQIFEQKRYRHDYDIGHLFANLLGLAAYTRMRRLLDQYVKK